jgi:hypothetical protein
LYFSHLAHGQPLLVQRKFNIWLSVVEVEVVVHPLQILLVEAVQVACVLLQDCLLLLAQLTRLQ